jgi:glycogen debranching enzyme
MDKRTLIVLLQFRALFSLSARCVGKSTRNHAAHMHRSQFSLTLAVIFALTTFATAQSNAAAESHAELELSRAVRHWEFMDAVGQHAAIFGWEDGRFEAWVYPFKVLRDFRLVFHTTNGRSIPAEALARTITVRPEATIIDYSSDAFSVRETLFVPVDQPGAVIQLDVQAWEPVQVEALFRRDMQLMWPAGLGATWQNWNDTLHAFMFGEESRKYVAFIGSPTGTAWQQEYENNYAQSNIDSLLLKQVAKGGERQIIVIAGSSDGQDAAERTYKSLLSDVDGLRQKSAAYYREYLARTTSVELPDHELQQAYDWARISTIQGLVRDPLLGTGLIAGYKTSGTGARPGFAWFFGRDSEWTSLALDAEGDFATTATAVDFLTKFQRKDGKIEHEIAQTAPLVNWFEKYPYPYAAADATPLFIIAVEQYARASGDVQFVRAHWDNMWRAYEFLRSTWDAQHHPQNIGVGHGWVEGGPLLPVKTELYQSGLGAEALRALASLARIIGQPNANELLQEYERQRDVLSRDFWSPEKRIFAFALDQQNRRVDTASVEATVPMWFGLLDPSKSDAMITTLAGEDHNADWGMRIISSRDPLFNPSGYHFGSVWPLFTGWAAVGEYRYHRPLAGYANLMANSLLTMHAPLGHTTEVLSGAYNETLSTGSPHQIWSSAMVISPLLRGLMGLDFDAQSARLTFSPHVPADWTHFALHGVRLGKASCELTYDRPYSAPSARADAITLTTHCEGGAVTIDFSPALGLHAKVDGASIDSSPAKSRVEPSVADQHVRIEIPNSSRPVKTMIRLHDDFDVSLPVTLPLPGQPSRNIKAVSATWNDAHDQVVLEFSGLAGQEYKLPVRSSSSVRAVAGAELAGDPNSGSGALLVRFPGATTGYTHTRVTVTFLPR